MAFGHSPRRLSGLVGVGFVNAKTALRGTVCETMSELKHPAAFTRRQVNRRLNEASAFFAHCGFALPPFAHWSRDEWQEKATGRSHIFRAGLGWDITDFGSGDFERCGLLLFTLRNGDSKADERANDTDYLLPTYCEKVMQILPGQVTPTHFHFRKKEDIIVRGALGGEKGGRLCVQVWNRSDTNDLAQTPVHLLRDGEIVEAEAGTILTLSVGESVTLPPFCYHAFWADEDGSAIVVGEVSTVNDDATDNFFHHTQGGGGRMPEIAEDTLPTRLLTVDYARFLGM